MIFTTTLRVFRHTCTPSRHDDTRCAVNNLDTMPQIQYSEKYYDDVYEYRCVDALRLSILFSFLRQIRKKNVILREEGGSFLGGSFGGKAKSSGPSSPVVSPIATPS